MLLVVVVMAMAMMIVIVMEVFAAACGCGGDDCETFSLHPLPYSLAHSLTHSLILSFSHLCHMQKVYSSTPFDCLSTNILTTKRVSTKALRSPNEHLDERSWEMYVDHLVVLGR